MSNPNNLYNILAAFNKATRPEEDAKADVKQQAKMIYESVEAKSSIIGGVRGVEKKLGDAFAKHKVSEAKKAKKDYDKDGKIESEKDEVIGSRRKAAGLDEVWSGPNPDKKSKSEEQKYVAKLKQRNTKPKKDEKKPVNERDDREDDEHGGGPTPWQNPDKGWKPRNQMDEAGDDTIGFSVNSEAAYNAVMARFGDYIDHDETSGIMYAPTNIWHKVEEVAFNADGQGATEQTDMDEAAGDDIQWYDRPSDGNTTTDTPTGRIHKAGRGGYGNQVDDETPMALPQGQVARGRGRPKNLAGEMKRKAAAELLAKNGGVKLGRGRPKKAVAGAGEPDSAPQGTLGLHKFLFGPKPTGDSLPGKKGTVHKIKDTGTVSGRASTITDEAAGGMEEFFANAAKKIPGATVRTGSATAPRKPQSAAKPVPRKADPRQSDMFTSGPEDWYNQSTGGKRNMGDSRIPRRAAMSESRPSNLKGYLAEAMGGQDALEHIINRFKHEVRNFQAGGEMDNDLYEALFDYYSHAGEIPYGIAKGRTGDPYDWVAARFEQDNPAMDEAVDPLTIPAYKRKAAGQDEMSLAQVRAPRADSISDKRNLAHANGTRELDDLARLAGITTESVSVIGGDIEGDMEQEAEDRMNISTNQSSDGKKNVTVTADGQAAVALLQMLKMAGMGGSDAAHEQEVIISAQGDEDMGDDCEMEMEEEYANEPAPQYQSVEKQMSAGDDMNRQKKQNFPMRQPGNNPMSEAEQVTELSKSTLGSYAKKANAERSNPGMDDMKADRRGTGVMQAIDKAAGSKAGPVKGNAAQARFSAAKGQPSAGKDQQRFEKSVDRVTKESSAPSMGRDLMAEYKAMKLRK